MVIELILLFAFAVAIGVVVVKVIEWRLDSLYGQYLGRERVEQKTAAIDRATRCSSKEDTAWSLVSSLQRLIAPRLPPKPEAKGDDL